MKDIEQIVEAAVSKCDPEGKLSIEQLNTLLNAILPKISKQFLSRLLKNSPSMLSQKRRAHAGFKSRHARRWGKPFNLIETFIVIAHEAGEQFNAEYRNEAVKTKDYKTIAIIGLHVRALLAANEIFVLLQNGFADGALGRWRSLHEIAVIAEFLSQHEPTIAERYLAAIAVHSYKAMKQYQEYQEVAGLMPFSDTDVEKITYQYHNTLTEHGAEIDSDYGWAFPVLKTRRPTFFDLERSINLDHWRPRYRWASQYNHGNFKPHPTLLGMSGADENLLLAGPSNGGLTEPAQMMAVSLYLATRALLDLKPTIDHQVMGRVLEELAGKVASAFWSSEQRLLRWHAQKRAKNA